MARNASGTHSLPSGNPVVSGTSIASTTHNTTMSDISSELTDSLSRSGKGAMLAPLELANGAVGTPALSFDSDPDTGIYRKGANNLAMVAGGAEVLDIQAAGVDITGAVTVSTTAAISSNATVGGTLGVTGAATLSAGLTVTQSATDTDAATFTGNGTGDGITAVGGTGGGHGIRAVGGSTTGHGVYAEAKATGAAVFATPNLGLPGAGPLLYLNTHSAPNTAPMRIGVSAQPASGVVGDIYVTVAGVLKICTVAGTPGTWVSVGTQT